MWYDQLGIISIGCQSGGPEDGGLGDIKVDLWRLFVRHCHSTFSPNIAHFALALRIDGEFQQFGTESIDHIRRSRRDRLIGVDIVIPGEVWRDKSRNELRNYLAARVREALGVCVTRLRRDKEQVDEASLFAEVDGALSEFMKIDYDRGA